MPARAYVELEQENAALREQLDRVRFALSGHPRCDKHPDDDPVTCGWKRAVQGVQAALDPEDDLLVWPMLESGWRWRVTTECGTGMPYRGARRMVVMLEQVQPEDVLGAFLRGFVGGERLWSTRDSEETEDVTPAGVQRAAMRLWERHRMVGVY